MQILPNRWGAVLTSNYNLEDFILNFTSEDV